MFHWPLVARCSLQDLNILLFQSNHLFRGQVRLNNVPARSDSVICISMHLAQWFPSSPSSSQDLSYNPDIWIVPTWRRASSNIDNFTVIGFMVRIWFRGPRLPELEWCNISDLIQSARKQATVASNIAPRSYFRTGARRRSDGIQHPCLSRRIYSLEH
jgi:hypothetical protein